MKIGKSKDDKGHCDYMEFAETLREDVMFMHTCKVDDFNNDRYHYHLSKDEAIKIVAHLRDVFGLEG